MQRTFIFYRPDLPAFSPAVGVWWPGKVIDLFNLLRFERVALRFSSAELQGFEFEDTAGYCTALHDKPTFSRVLQEAFAGGAEERVSRWQVEVRRYEVSRSGQTGG